MSERPKRPVLSSRKNSKTGEIEFYEMMPDEAEAAIKRFIESLAKPKPVTPQDIENEATRGRDNGRRFLAGNPTQQEIEQSYEWSFEDAANGNDGPLKPCL